MVQQIFSLVLWCFRLTCIFPHDKTQFSFNNTGARWKNLRWQMPQDRAVIKKSITVWVMDILIRAGMP